MDYQLIWLGHPYTDKKTVQKFLKFPATIYKKKYLTQDKKTERALIYKKHVLSKYFVFLPVILLCNNRIIARAALTFYENSDIAYLGFFESIDDEHAALFFLNEIVNKAKEQGYKRIQGPMDASFWIGYRMKSNRFSDLPYFLGRYNHEYYLEYWKKAGFIPTDRYVSNIFPKLNKKGYKNEKFKARLQEFTKRGYEIISPDPKDWDKVISEVYRLIMNLYSDFPAFCFISKEDFLQHYSAMKNILDFSIVKLAYYHGKAVAFFLSSPNYGLKLNRRITPLTLLEILKKRKGCDDYVLLYMGVEPEHTGLGKAITQAVITRLAELEAQSIGSYIHEGKINQMYADDINCGHYEYLLFERTLA